LPEKKGDVGDLRRVATWYAAEVGLGLSGRVARHGGPSALKSPAVEARVGWKGAIVLWAFKITGIGSQVFPVSCWCTSPRPQRMACTGAAA